MVGVVPFSYRRPAQSLYSRESSKGDSDATHGSNASLSSGKSCMIKGIPEQLSFDRIINGGTCPPCTKRDFFNYLKYIEHGAENLLFYLWYLDYEKRFNGLPETERILSPEWTEAQATKEAIAYRNQVKSRAPAKANSNAIFKPLDDEKAAYAHHDDDQFSDSTTERGVASLDSNRPLSPAPSSAPTAGTHSTARTVHSQRSAKAFDDAGLKWQPFTVQPYREEMSRIITLYLADKSPRQLNLAGVDLAATLHALEVTTHPTAFRNIVRTVEYTLRNQSHPNFIRWTICNGNRPRVVFARGLGIFLIAAAILVGILLACSSAGRGWRAFVFPLLLLGVSTLIAAWKGMCVVLHGLHHRHLRPWELFDGDDVKAADSDRDSFESDLRGPTYSWEDEPWVPKYAKRNVVRKIFDREVWIEEPVLRQIQDTIFLQSMAGAFVVAAIGTVVFCVVPKGNLY